MCHILKTTCSNVRDVCSLLHHVFPWVPALRFPSLSSQRHGIKLQPQNYVGWPPAVTFLIKIVRGDSEIGTEGDFFSTTCSEWLIHIEIVKRRFSAAQDKRRRSTMTNQASSTSPRWREEEVPKQTAQTTSWSTPGNGSASSGPHWGGATWPHSLSDTENAFVQLLLHFCHKKCVTIIMTACFCFCLWQIN